MDMSGVRCLTFAADGTVTAEQVVSLLAQQGIGVTLSASEAECFELLGRQRWHLLVIDANGAMGGPLGLLARCRTAHPDVSVLVLVPRGGVATAVQAVKAGAADCIETPVQPARLFSAVAPLCRQAPRDPFDPRRSLTRVERTVLRHILDGRTSREIAKLLGRSTKTVEAHRRHIMKKLGADSLVDLVTQMMQAGLVDPTTPDTGAGTRPAADIGICGP